MQLAAASMMFPCRHLHLQQHCCQRVPQDCGAMATDSDKKHFQQTCSCEWHSWLAVSPKHRWTQTCNMCSLYVAMTIRWKPICVRQTKMSSLATSSYSWLRHQSSEIPHMQTTTFNKKYASKTCHLSGRSLRTPLSNKWSLMLPKTWSQIELFVLRHETSQNHKPLFCSCDVFF